MIELGWQRLRTLEEAVDSFDEVEVARAWQPLEQLYSDHQYFAAKAALTRSDEFIDECYEAHRRLGPTRHARSASLIQSLVDLLVIGERDPERGLSLSNVNAWISYRQDTELLERLFAAGIDRSDSLGPGHSAEREKLVFKCRTRLGGLHRRQGRLVESAVLLQDALPYWEQAGDLKELGTAEYEWAYVFFLRNKLSEAAPFFDRSATHAFRSGDESGGWISRCLHLRCRFLSGEISARELAAELETARCFFQETADRTSPNAMRWVTNTKMHLFEAAFCSLNSREAEQLFRSMSTDPWVKERYAKERPDWSFPLEARLAMLDEEWPQAVEFFEKHIPFATTRKAGEALAREYLDLGISHAEGGQRDKAFAAWQAGMDCPDEKRNGLWKEEIMKARRLVEETGRCWKELRGQLRR